MLAAFLTTVFFSTSAICANRSIRVVGTTWANLGRLVTALVFLGLYAHLLGPGIAPAGTRWFLLSGIIGMGLGDIAMFGALPLIGSRLTVLITQCLAAPIAAIVEWLWLGTVLSAAEIWWSSVILGGVTLAIMPGRKDPPRVKVRFGGFVFGVLSAAGQGLGAVVSRKGFGALVAAGQSMDGITSAYLRITGGLAITVVYYALFALLRRPPPGTEPPPADPVRPASYFWVIANGLAGPVLGVSCYQWALAGTPSGIVLPIVAATPLVIVPLSRWFEGERPSRRSLVGGAIAVIGAVGLTLA